MTGLPRLWPKSLWGQIVAVAALALLVAQGVNFTLLMAASRNQSEAQAAALAVARIAAFIDRQARQDFADAPDGDRRGAGRRGSPPPGRGKVQVTAAPVLPPGWQVEEGMADKARGLLRSIGTDARDLRIVSGDFATAPPGMVERRPLMEKLRRAAMPDRVPTRAVIVSYRQPDGRWLNAAAPVLPRDPATFAWLVMQTLVLTVAVLLPLALIARRISRPLGQLRQRADRFGGATAPEPMAEEGPDDVRSLIAAFNAMQRRVAALVGEKDVMLGAIGHDLKTPLASLRLRAEMVDDDDERERMTETIGEMAAMLDDILMLARLGQSGEAVQRTDVSALVRAVAEEYEDRGAAVTLAEPLPRLIAPLRPMLIRRAMRNLIDNALKYGGSAELAVEQAGGRVRVAVRDRGPGIDPAEADRLFEPFVRAEASRNRATGGSGLGLTLTRAIARAHGGDAMLRPRDGGGTEAVLTLAGD